MKPILFVAALLAIGISLKAQPVKVMLVTGGHSYDTLQFFQMFESLAEIDCEHFSQPQANKAIANGDADAFDVLVFYDMWRNISEAEKQGYIDLTKAGKPFLFLHHALVSYQDWPEFERLLGGRYVQNSDLKEEEQSTYKHDVWVEVEVVDDRHPVTKGMDDFRIFDEVYGNYRVLPGVKPLLKTSHPESTPVIGWENRYNESNIIYLQSGHDSNAYKTEAFRTLLSQAITYLASK